MRNTSGARADASSEMSAHEMSALYSSCWSSAVVAALRVTGRRWVAEEIAQDVFTWFWQNPGRYDSERGSYRSLISTAARCRAVDWQRSESARSRRELASDIPAPSTADDPLLRLDEEHVFEAVMALPGDLREPIHLAFWGGMTYRQVALHLGIPEGTAKSRLRTAQLRLREQLRVAERPTKEAADSDCVPARPRAVSGESRNDTGLRELFAAMPARHRSKSARRVPRCGFMDRDFMAANDRPTIVTAALDAVLHATGTRMGKVQLRDESSGHLRIESHRGLNGRFVDYFASVRDIDSASGYPLERGHRIIVRDVTRSRVFSSGAREIVLGAGARAVQATPVIDSSGRLLGLLSTHHETPRRPENMELRLLDLVAQWIGRLVEPCSRAG